MFIHNISDSEKTYIGIPIDVNAFYQIPSEMLTHYSVNEELLTDIMNGDASISIDGVSDIDSKPNMLNALSGNEINISGKSKIQGAIPVTMYKPEEESFTRATHDFTNKTTWYSNSIRISDETLTTSDDLTYSAVNDYFIDVIGKVLNRQDLHQDKAIIIKVDDVVVDDGFTIDHVSGEVTFSTAQTGKTIKCSYNYATNSEWILKPDANKLLIIEHSEVQFSKDVEINTPLRFEIWVYNPGHLVVGHPYEHYGLKIPYQNIQYNSIRDLVNEANLGTGYIPQMGDLPGDILVFPFNYVSVKPFASSVGAELRIKSVNDVELTGSYGTATFYLISRNE